MNDAPIPLRFDKDARLDMDLPCRRCRYNLRGLGAEDRCPECAWPVQSSIGNRLLLDAPVHEFDAARRTVRAFSAGFTLLMIAVALFPVLFGTTQKTAMMLPFPVRSPRLVALPVTLMALAAAILFARGCRHVARMRLPAPPARRASGPLHGLTGVFVLTSIALLARFLIGEDVPLDGIALTMTAAIAALSLVAATAIALLRFRELAGRIPHERLALHFLNTLLLWGAVAAFVLAHAVLRVVALAGSDIAPLHVRHNMADFPIACAGLIALLCAAISTAIFTWQLDAVLARIVTWMNGESASRPD
jgi:hypothetical protein